MDSALKTHQNHVLLLVQKNVNFLIVRFVIYRKNVQRKKSQKTDLPRKNIGQVWIQHRKLLWK